MGGTSELMAGVIEGFYGQPWSRSERLELFDWMSAWGLNTYLYAPKDDLKHRTLWRESYTESEAALLREIIGACAQRKINFIYALAPGLDIKYSNEAETTLLQNRFTQIVELGGTQLALLFDDIPDRMRSEDAARFGSFASAQCHVTNAMYYWLRERSQSAKFFFCPTPYCGRMAERGLGGKDYLPIIGRELHPEINIFWTGPEIISEEIPPEHIRELGTVLRRKPIIWDNLHANDYDGRRFYCGPYGGRPPELRGLVAGFLSNPNNEFPLNYIPLRSLGEFTRGTDEWDARASYLAGLREWFPRFATVGQPISFEDLVAFGDCFYLPHSDGPEAEALYAEAEDVVQRPNSNLSHIPRLREFCGRLAEIKDRPLFYALSRRVWELREELDLIERYASRPASGAFRSDFHLPKTYRGGFVPRLQRLLKQQSDGSFSP